MVTAPLTLQVLTDMYNYTYRGIQFKYPPHLIFFLLTGGGYLKRFPRNRL